MLTEWDPGKARLNAGKHGVSFPDAVASLEDEGALTMRDPFSEEEERWVTMGARRKRAFNLRAESDTARAAKIR